MLKANALEPWSRCLDLKLTLRSSETPPLRAFVP